MAPKPPTLLPPPPDEISLEYSAWTWEVASHYPPNSIAYRLTGRPGETRFLKITRRGWVPSAEAEALRLRWAQQHLPVPGVIESGRDATKAWLLTAGLPGRDATDTSFRSDVPGLVALLAKGLRRFHDAPAGACPFRFRVEDALRAAGRRLKAGEIDANRDFHEEHAHLSPTEAFDLLLRTRPEREDLVVCHGDYCLPNVLIDRGEVVGYVDVGELGVADRWWDIAVGSWSVTWNLGPGYEDLFFSSYGVEPDAGRVRFYRLLYDLVS